MKIGPIEKMCENGLFSDWTIISSDDCKFPCHRNILAVKSSTMKAMMTIDMKEKEEGKTKIPYHCQELHPRHWRKGQRKAKQGHN